MTRFIAIVGTLCLTGAAAVAQPLGIGTSPQGTLTYALGAAYGQVVTDKMETQARVQPQSGTGVMVPLVNNGELDIGFVNTQEITEAFTGTGTFDGRPQENLRMVGVLFPIRVGLFVRDDSDYRTIGDLSGARIATGYTSQQIIQTVLTAALANGGLTGSDIEPVPVPNLIRGVDEFIAGNVDAGFFAIGPAKVSEADASVGGIRFLPMSDDASAVAAMKEIVPSAYIDTVQPSPNLAGVDGPVKTMHYNYVMFVNADLPEDLVYRLVDTLVSQKPALGEAMPRFNAMNAATLWRDFGVPYHAGALRYFEENGIEPSS